MAHVKPTSRAEYIAWLKNEHNVAIDRRTQNHFEAVASRFQSSFASSGFWQQLLKNLKNYHEQFLVQTAYDLLTTFDPPRVLMKPFNSFLLKTFRRNVMENSDWPAAPPGGWLLPANWYSGIHDIARTSLVVKYLDGVEFIVRRIEALCGETSVPSTISFEATEEGYYAAHVNVRQEVEVPRFADWDTEIVEAQLEIQVTTQLQDVIKRLLHKYYEQRRAQVRPGEGDATRWQWDYRSDEFVTNYLGHILHYVEGMIMDVRGRQAAAATAGTLGGALPGARSEQ